MVANKAKDWLPNQMGNTIPGKDNCIKIHQTGGSFSILSMWLKICAGLHLCTISVAIPAVYISEKVLREFIKSRISLKNWPFRKTFDHIESK